jgi:phage terminase small subunit
MNSMVKNNGRPKKPDGRKISRKLTLRQRRFVAEYTNPESEGFGNQTKAAELAGYSKLAPGQSGHQLLKNIEVRSEVDRITNRELNHIFDAAGVTIERLAKRVRQGLDAKETKAFIHQKTGNVVYSKRMIAHDIRLKAIRIAADLRGDFAPKEINFNVSLLASKLQAARRREMERQQQPSERTVQGVRVEEGENNTQEADNLGGAPQAEEKTKQVQLSE